MTSPPILILAYNRPEFLQSTLSRLVAFGIDECYVSIDGPKTRNHQDALLVGQTISVLLSMQSKLSIKFLIHEENLGCNRGVTTAINWFFENVESGIILEDDLEFDLDLIKFLSEGLSDYEAELKIGSINGYRERFEKFPHLYSEQVFSSYPSSWGWATWGNRWKLFESELNLQFKLELIIKLVIRRRISESFHWVRKIRRLRNGEIDSWAYRWLLTNLKNNWLSVIPPENLVTNRGVGIAATHTHSLGNRNSNRGRYRNNLEVPLPKATMEYDKFLRTRVYGIQSVGNILLRKLFNKK